MAADQQRSRAAASATAVRALVLVAIVGVTTTGFRRLSRRAPVRPYRTLRG